MFWAKQTRSQIDLKIEHSFCYYSNSKQLLIIFSRFRETYSVLILKKLNFILILGDI